MSSRHIRYPWASDNEHKPWVSLRLKKKYNGGKPNNQPPQVGLLSDIPTPSHPYDDATWLALSLFLRLGASLLSLGYHQPAPGLILPVSAHGTLWPLGSHTCSKFGSQNSQQLLWRIILAFTNEGFQKMGLQYPQIIHFRLGFSIIKHPAIGASPFMNHPKWLNEIQTSLMKNSPDFTLGRFTLFNSLMIGLYPCFFPCKMGSSLWNMGRLPAGS